MNKSNLIKVLVFVLILAMFLPALITKFGNTEAPKPKVVEAPKVKVDVPNCSGDSMFASTAKQISFGPRIPNSKSHKNCKDWIVKKLKSYGVTVEEQNFTEKAYDGTTLQGTNIIGKINPGNNRRIMLASHWDTRPFADSDPNPANHKKPFDSADDGATGVASLIEIARVLQSKPTEVGVDLVFFDLEDYGAENGDLSTWGLGSQYWAKNKGSYMARFGILFDMTGSGGARFAKEGYSTQFAPNVTDKIWKIADELGFGSYFIDEKQTPITDDHYYVNTIAHIPMVDIINRKPDGSFGDYHHTLGDNMSIVDRNTLSTVVKVVLEVIYREDKKVFL
jgi:glutaminyl-peptide cyclotransferase